MTHTLKTLATVTCLALLAVPVRAQTATGTRRISFFADGSSSADTAGGAGSSFSELVTTLTAQAPIRETAGIDYALDVRFAAYPNALNRANLWSIYNAWFGMQSEGRRYVAKVGQIWLTDLGALGSLGGAVGEFRRPLTGKRGTVRFGAFGGLEPEILKAGYVSGVRKIGGYVAFDGGAGRPRRHVLGYVNIRDHGLTERSVLSFTNYLPVGNNVFVYQAAEYDLSGPAGLGSGGLAYFFTNARANLTPRIEIQGLYHRGRSIDVRRITTEQLDRQPIDPKALDGFRYESAGGRVTVGVARTVRVFVGYAVDKNNSGDPSTGRLQAGLWATNLGGSGLDINVSDSRFTQAGATNYDSWYASVGRLVAARVYLTGEFTSSFSLLHFAGTTFTIENRPRTRRYGLSGLVNVTRLASVLFTAERVEDAAFTENRVMSGITYRF